MCHIFRVQKSHKAILAALATPLVLIAVIASVWGVDAWMSRDSVARNVQLAGVDVGGMSRDELRATVEQMAKDVPATPLTVNAADLTKPTTLGEAGLSVNVDATVEEVWNVGRTDPLPTPPLRWLSSLVSPRTYPVIVGVDTAKLGETIGFLEGEERIAPVEPTIEIAEDGVKLVPGTPGREISMNSVVQSLPLTLDRIGEPVTVDVERATIPPATPDSAIQGIVDQANGITQGTVTLIVGDERTEFDAARLRPAVTVVNDGPPGSPPRLSLDRAMVNNLLSEEVETDKSNPTGVRFNIENDVATPIAGKDAVVCCAPESGDLIVDGLLKGQREITLPTTTVTAQQGVDWANGLGVKEVIGEFTTNHPAGQPRVKNIHLIADDLKGVLIPPGATFSVNDTVGKRTAEKGYVNAPVIYDGEFKEDIGGGVSQFATTLFNAAFFGGLDIPYHMAHTKYISRYPYGREATLAYPSVDLKIKNNTPFGVVIWPSYTDTSISVKLYSTPYVSGRQTGQNQSSGCGTVVTRRLRTYTDGHTDNDQFTANYDCEDKKKN